MANPEKNRIITLAGKPGSGKSSTAREVAKLLHYEHVSAGKMVRQIAKENGLTLAEANAEASENPAMDTKIDRYLQGLAERSDLVVDSRLGFHWIPNSFKVYLELDSDIAVARIYRDMEKAERKGEVSADLDEVWDQVQARTRGERERFMDLYQINPFSQKNYDLIVHTERNNPLTVSLWVHDQYLKWLETDYWTPVVEKVPLGFSQK